MQTAPGNVAPWIIRAPKTFHYSKVAVPGGVLFLLLFVSKLRVMKPIIHTDGAVSRAIWDSGDCPRTL